MLVVATLSLKGGVGKTTVALGLAGAAQAHGVRTLVVDLDPQANATVALDAGASAATVADVLDEPTRAVLRRAIVPSGWGDGVDVLVGAEQTERHNRPDPGAVHLGRLSRALSRLDGLFDGFPAAGSPADGFPAGSSPTGSSPMGSSPTGSSPTGGHPTDGHPTDGHRTYGHPTDGHRVDGAPVHRGAPAPAGHADGDPYRLVIVDCPPSLGQLTRSALSAADRALLVTDPTMFAVSGVQRAFDAVHTERERGNPNLQPLGVLVNRVRPRNSEHEFRIGELRELFGPLVFSTVLPDRSAVQQAQGACLPIQRWDTPGAREISAVFTTLLGRVLRSSRTRPGTVRRVDPRPDHGPAARSDEGRHPERAHQDVVSLATEH